VIIEEIIFSYKVLDIASEIKDSRIIIRPRSESRVLSKGQYHVGGYNLPNTMDFTKWGEYEIVNNHAIVKKQNSTAIYDIKMYETHNQIALMSDDKILISFKDIKQDHNKLDCFIRELEKHEYHFYNGKVILKKIIRYPKFLKQIQKSVFRS
jgi:hypothetical protein